MIQSRRWHDGCVLRYRRDASSDCSRHNTRNCNHPGSHGAEKGYRGRRIPRRRTVQSGRHVSTCVCLCTQVHEQMTLSETRIPPSTIQTHLIIWIHRLVARNQGGCVVRRGHILHFYPDLLVEAESEQSDIAVNVVCRRKADESSGTYGSTRQR